MVLKAHTLSQKVSQRILILGVLKIFDVNFYVLFVRSVLFSCLYVKSHLLARFCSYSERLGTSQGRYRT